MAIDLDVEVAIAAPPADVFTHISDVEHWPDWLIASGIVRVERLEPGRPLQRDSALRIEQRVAGRAATLEAKVTELDPGTRFAVAGRDADGITVGIDARLAPGDTGTRLRWHLRIALPLKFRVFEGMAKPQVERAVRLDLEAFRRRMGIAATD